MLRTECLAVLEDAPPLSDLFSDVRRMVSRPRRPFLLESSSNHSQFGRWSFFGAEPFLTLTVFSNGSRLTRFLRWGKKIGEHRKGHPLSVLRDTLNAYQAEPDATLPPFRGGAVGALAYELGAFTEPVRMKRSQESLASGLPILDVAFYHAVVAYDHAERRVYFLRTDIPDADDADWLTRLAAISRMGGYPSRLEPLSRLSQTARSSLSRQAFVSSVRRIQDSIAAGEVYQVNLTQRFTTGWGRGPMELYARLRERNPAPFSAFLETEGCVLLSSSPERFLRYDAATRRLETRPIKGTRPRGDSPERDALLAEELMRSEKEAAELVMIVDLERNDLGRVCEYGSVRVPELRAVEKYATVQHTVGTVEGTVRRDKSVADILGATFPGGSITGAPKIQAMRMIDELEPCRRNFYTGALGYFDFGGGFDLNIAIRAMTCFGTARVDFGVGSGIVADSDPEAEYQETLDKARPLFDALEVKL